MRILTYLAVFLSAHTVYADIITKTDNTQIEGTVLRVTNQGVEYSTDKLPFLKLNRDQVRKIQYKSGEVAEINAGVDEQANLAPRASSSPSNQTPRPAKKRYSKAWTVELGGSLGYSGYVLTLKNKTSSVDFNTVHQVFIAPSLALFLTDQFSLGVTGAFTTIFVAGSSTSSIAAYLNPAYTLDTGSFVFPYIGGLFGYANSSDSLSAQPSTGGLGYGARGGVKFAVASDILIDCGLQYLVQNYSGSSYYSVYSGYDGLSLKTFSFSVGISTWL